MQPIQNSRSHRSDRKDSIETIYYTPVGFFIATASALSSIELIALRYTNRGEPFAELARLEYQSADLVSDSEYTRSIDIELDDAVELIRFCASVSIELLVQPELLNNRRFKLAIASTEPVTETVPVLDPLVS